MHVQLTAVVEELGADTETPDQARTAMTAHLDRLAEQGVPATAQILTTALTRAATCSVVRVDPDRAPRQLTSASLPALRDGAA